MLLRGARTPGGRQRRRQDFTALGVPETSFSCGLQMLTKASFERSCRRSPTSNEGHDSSLPRSCDVVCRAECSPSDSVRTLDAGRGCFHPIGVRVREYQLPFALTHTDDLSNPIDCRSRCVEANIDLLDHLGRDIKYVYLTVARLFLYESTRIL